jgi:hypothetical protein
MSPLFLGGEYLHSASGIVCVCVCARRVPVSVPWEGPTHSLLFYSSCRHPPGRQQIHSPALFLSFFLTGTNLLILFLFGCHCVPSVVRVASWGERLDGCAPHARVRAPALSVSRRMYTIVGPLWRTPPLPLYTYGTRSAYPQARPGHDTHRPSYAGATTGSVCGRSCS